MFGIKLGLLLTLVVSLVISQGELSSNQEKMESNQNTDQLFIYHVTLTEKYNDPDMWTEETQQIIADHAEFLNDLGRNGMLIQAGRTLYDPGDERLFGIVIFKAESLEEAKKMIENDPSRLKGVQEGEVHPFSLGIRFLENLN